MASDKPKGSAPTSKAAGMTNTPENWLDEQALIERAERWVAEVEAAYADGGYAAGDGPTAPLDEMVWLLAERRKALTIIDAWHQLSNHLHRMVEASPNMRLIDAIKDVQPDYERIRGARHGTPE